MDVTPAKLSTECVAQWRSKGDQSAHDLFTTSAYLAGLLRDLQTFITFKKIIFHEHHQDTEPLGPRLFLWCQWICMYNVHNVNTHRCFSRYACFSNHLGHPNLSHLYDSGTRNTAHAHVWVNTLASVKLHDGSSTDYIIETAARIIAACHHAVLRVGFVAQASCCTAESYR